MTKRPVDLYAYTSMTLAAAQAQQKELDAMKRELSALKEELAAMKGKGKRWADRRAAPPKENRPARESPGPLPH